MKQDHFFYLSPFMNKDFFHFINAFKFIIFFNLLTLSKTFNLEPRLVIGCSPVMSHIHVHVLHKLRIKPEFTEKVDDQHHGTNKAGLEWFGFVNSKLIL